MFHATSSKGWVDAWARPVGVNLVRRPPEMHCCWVGALSASADHERRTAGDERLVEPLV